MFKIEKELDGRKISMETGRVAKQAHGAIWIRSGETILLVTAVSDRQRDVDFVPLTVDYQEMAYAAGKIPGGFLKREGKLGDHETLISRLIDRPMRPLFPKGYNYEVQVIATVMSAEMECQPDILALNAASAALMVSDIPFDGPVGAVRVGRVDGEWVINPGEKEIAAGDVNLIVAGTREAVVMVEGGAGIVPEDEVIAGIFFGHEKLQVMIDMQEELVKVAGRPNRDFTPKTASDELKERVDRMCRARMDEAFRIADKMDRHGRIEKMRKEVLEELAEDFPDSEILIMSLMEDLEKEIARGMIVRERTRIDGRSRDQVRPVSCDVGLLPRVHGSGLFTRGETQVLALATLGTADDEQRIDTLSEEELRKSFILHYRFLPFCVGETKMLRGPGRREIGHGALAARGIQPVLPSSAEFPYTIRVVAEVLESNGSSSMASACGTSLALMDAGVPISSQVAGVAMGLIKEGDEFVVLTDILGDEDHLGDMDFKVIGTENGVTAIQMDIKIQGVTREIMERAMQQAKEARLFILGRMAEAIASPRDELSPHAPRITTMKVKPEKIRDIIGPGGRVIRKIVDDTGVKIDVQDDGTVQIASTNKERTDKAIEQIKALTEEAEVGAVYQGVVKKIMDFGAFVEIFPGTDGLLHISQLDHGHPRQVTDILQEGDEVKVKVLAVDENGKIRLSRKALLENKSQDGEEVESDSEEDRGDRSSREGRPSSRGRGQSRGHGRKDNSRQRR